MIYIHFAFCIFGIIINSFSQNTTINSLENQLQETYGSEKVNTSNELSKYCIKDSIKLALLYGKEASNLALQKNDNEGGIDAFNSVGNYFCIISEYDSAIMWFNRGLRIAQENGYKNKTASIQKKIGGAYYFKNQLVNAISFFLEALRQYEDINNREGIAIIKNSIGVVYYKMGNSQKALHYLTESLNICEEIDNLYFKSQVLNNIGNAYDSGENYIEALSYYKRSLLLKQKFNNKKTTVSTLHNIGNIFFKIGDIDSANIYFNIALKDAQEINYKRGEAQILANMAKVFFTKRKINKTIKTLNKAEIIANSNNEKDVLANIYEQYAQVFFKLKQYKTANRYKEKHITINKELYNEQWVRKVTELEIKYETEKKDGKIKLLKREKEIEKANTTKQSVLKYLFLGGLLFLLITAILLYRSNCQKNKLNITLKHERKFNQILMDANPNPQYLEGEDGKYIDCNYSFAQAIGLSKDKIIGKTEKDILKIGIVKNYRVLPVELFTHSALRKYQATITFPNKNKCEYEIIKRTIDNAEGKASGILGVLIDISHIKKQEEKILEQEKLIFTHEKEKLKKHIELKGKEMTELTLKLVQNNRYVTKFIEKLNSLKQYTNKIGEFTIQSHIAEYQSILENKNWDEFEQQFKEAHQKFYNKLLNIYPDLTLNERKICLLSYSKLSTKEIADITYKSTRTIQNTRMRIRKKMNITDSDCRLYDFLTCL